MPIFDRILSRPFSAAVRNCATRLRGRGPRRRLGLLLLPASALARRSRRTRREREPGVHRLGAVADQRGEVVDVEGVAGLGHEADPGAQARCAPDAGGRRPIGEQHRDRRTRLVRGAVADHDDAGAAPRRALGRAPRGR